MCSSDLATTSGTITGLTNGTTYWFRVSAENVKGEGAKSTVSASVTARTVPDAPTLDSVVRGDRQFTISLTAPTWDGGSAITSFQYSTNGGTSWSTLSGTSPYTVINQSGGTTRLVNGTAYTVSVRAVNVAGAGAASSSLSRSPATTPGAPTAAAAVRGNQELSITWTAPAVTGGATISNYRVTVYAADGSSSASGVTGDATREVG